MTTNFVLNKLYNDTYRNTIERKPRNKSLHYLLFWNDKDYMNMYNSDSYHIRTDIAKALNTNFKDILLFVNTDKLQVGFKIFNDNNVKNILNILAERYMKYRSSTIKSNSTIKTPITDKNKFETVLNKTEKKKVNILDKLKKIYNIKITKNIYDALETYDPDIKYNGKNICKIKITYTEDFLINRKDIIKSISKEFLVDVNLIIKFEDSLLEIIFDNDINNNIGKILVSIEQWDNSFLHLHPSQKININEILIKKNKSKINKKYSKNKDFKSNTIENDENIKDITLQLINNDENDSESDNDCDVNIIFSKGPGTKGTRITKNEKYNRGSINRNKISNENKKNKSAINTDLDKLNLDNIHKKTKKNNNIDMSIIDDNNLSCIGIVTTLLGNCRVKVLKTDINNSNITEVVASICGSLKKHSKNIIKIGDVVLMTSMFDNKYYIESKLTDDIIKYNIENDIIDKYIINNLIKKYKLSKFNDIDSDDDNIIFEDDEFNEYLYND